MIARNNYYEILEVSPQAAQHEISSAYERAKNTYSGDNPAIYTIFSEPEARELLTLIEEAYSVLGNKTLRTVYDQRLHGSSAVSQELSFDSIMRASKTLFPESRAEVKKVQFQVNEAMEKEIQETTEWTGEMLKRVREYKNITPEKMSEKTKINLWYVTAIEGMDSANLPAIVFVRGYVVQMSKELGLNEKRVAESYIKLFKAKKA